MSAGGALLLAAALAAAPGSMGNAPAEAAMVFDTGADAARLLVLPAGTPVRLVTTGDISSKTHRQGDRFELVVAEDVVVQGHVAVPRGSAAVGEVVRHAASGAFGRAGKLELAPLWVMVGSHRIRLDGKARAAGESGAAGAVIASTVIGGFASFISGRSAWLPAGAALTGYVHRDLPLRIGPATPAD